MQWKTTPGPPVTSTLGECYVFGREASDHDRASALLAAVDNLEASSSETMRAEGQQLREAVAQGFRGGTRDPEPDATAYVVDRAAFALSMNTAVALRDRVRLTRISGARRASARASRGKAVRTRGSRRSRAAPSGGDDGPGLGESDPERRCGCGCGADIGHRALQARYLDDSHAATDRKRRERARARVESPAISARELVSEAELARLTRRIIEGCRCNGSHIADPADGHCIKCGHRRGWSGLPIAGSVVAGSAETRHLRPAGAVQHAA